MIRLILDIPLTASRAIYETQDQIHNVLIHAMAVHGYHPPQKHPAAWGFGVVSRPLRGNGSRQVFRVQRIYVGSSHPDVAATLARITPEDLRELSQVPQAGLDLHEATIHRDLSWQVTSEVLAVYPLSPIRVLEHRDGANGSTALLTLGDAWESALNRTMARRFGRPFHLQVIPDDLYIRERQGRITASRPIKKDPHGRPVVLPGLEFPFILIGPPEDLRDAWINGLGAGTGMGFGCLAI